jgi:hypothetical protein
VSRDSITTEQTMGAPPQALLRDRQPEEQQIRAQDPGRSFKSLPVFAGIGYGIAWIAGFSAWPSNLAVNASKKAIVSLYAAHASQAGAQYLLVEGVAGVFLGMVLLSCIRHVRRYDRTWTSVAAAGGGIAVSVSLLQCLLGLVLVSSTNRDHLAQSGDIYQLINRLDGVKQLLLGGCVVLLAILLRTTSNYPRWLGRTTVIVGIALASSGLAYLLLWNVLAGTAFMSLPLLILWVASTGAWLGAERQRGLHAESPRESGRVPAAGQVV